MMSCGDHEALAHALSVSWPINQPRKDQIWQDLVFTSDYDKKHGTAFSQDTNARPQPGTSGRLASTTNIYNGRTEQKEEEAVI